MNNISSPIRKAVTDNIKTILRLEYPKILKEIKSGFNFIEELGDNYDAVIVAVKHTSFQNLTINEWNDILKEKPVLFDLKGCCNNEIESDFSL